MANSLWFLGQSLSRRGLTEAFLSRANLEGKHQQDEGVEGVGNIPRAQGTGLSHGPPPLGPGFMKSEGVAVYEQRKAIVRRLLLSRQSALSFAATKHGRLECGRFEQHGDGLGLGDGMLHTNPETKEPKNDVAH